MLSKELKCHICSEKFSVSNNNMVKTNGLFYADLECLRCGTSYSIPNPMKYRVTRLQVYCPLNRFPVLLIKTEKEELFWTRSDCSLCIQYSKCKILKHIDEVID